MVLAVQSLGHRQMSQSGKEKKTIWRKKTGLNLMKSRERKMMDKGKEAKLDQDENARKAKLKQMTARINKTESSMLDYANVDLVEKANDVFCNILKDFAELQCSILNLLPEEEREDDHDNWYLPKVGMMEEFQNIVKKWLKEAAVHSNQMVETDLSSLVNTTNTGTLAGGIWKRGIKSGI